MYIALITAITYASNLYVSSKHTISDICMETIGTPGVLNIPLFIPIKGVTFCLIEGKI